MAVSFETTSVQLIAKLTSPVTDQQSWERFVCTYGPQIVAWCLDHGLQEADAHDVCQEVVLRIARQISRMEYDPNRSFRGWLFVVVRGAWADWVETRSLEFAAIDVTGALRRLADDGAGRDLQRRVDDCYQQELLERAAQRVRRRVAATTWQAFELQALQGLSPDEVCQRLSLNRGAVLAARCRVQKLLREEVELFESSS
jgi:RNA polymerase sigma factor (sigma-70 family)